MRQAKADQELGDFLFQQFCANTEERREEFWIAPAASNVFTLAEIQLFVKHSKRIVFTIGQIVSATPFLP